MRSLKFRYTLEGHEAAVKEFLEKQESYIVIRHDADEEVSRDHWHAWVRTAKTVETFRAQFKKVCEIGKEDYSIGTVKEGDDEVYIRYMCHGSKRGDKVHLVCMQALGYDEEKLQQLHEEFWKKRDEYRRPQKSAKGKVLNTVEQLIEYCKTEQVDMGSRLEVTKAAVTFMGRARRPINLFYIEGVINSILSLSPSGHAQLVARLMEKWESWDEKFSTVK